MKARPVFLAFFLVLVTIPSSAQQITLPKLCKPCLFYAGDLDPTNLDADAFWNENTLRDNNTQTFGGITVPKGRAILIQGILFQTLFVLTNELDPTQVTWEIRTGDIFNNGGTLVASGGGEVAMQPTGRLFNGGTEYTLAVRVNPAVELTGGQSPHGSQYWFNLMPECSNSQDPTCVSAQYYVTNTSTLVNAYNGRAQNLSPVTNSATHGYEWEYVCNAYGVVGNKCAWLSFGLMGKVVQ